STGGGIMMYDLGDAAPRVWPVVTPAPASDRNVSAGSTAGVAYTDIAIAGGALYYTQITLATNASLGHIGPVGAAALMQLTLNGLGANQSYTPAMLASLFPPTDLSMPTLVRGLGVAYVDASGNLTAGAWQITRAATRFVSQLIGDVNPSDATVISSFTLCRSASPGAVCGAILQSTGVYPLATHPALGLSPLGNHIALAAASTLYIQKEGNRTPTRLAHAGTPTSPTWSQDGRRVAVTQIIGAGLMQSDVCLYSPSGSGTVLVAGGQGLAWRP